MTLGLTSVLRRLHHDEGHLEKTLLVIGERHHTDHEVVHVTRQLAHWSHDNITAMASLADPHGDFLDDPGDPSTTGGTLAGVREHVADALGRRPGPALLLLRDLRELFLLASGNSVDWNMLAQAAQAARDERLVAVVTECHPRTLRQIKWCNATIKVLAPQTLTSV